MREKRVSGLTTASGFGPQPGLDLRLAEDSGSSVPFAPRLLSSSKKLAYQPILQGKQRQVNIYCEIPDPTIVQSIYNYCHFEDYQSIQVEARELDGEKYELVIRIHNDEEIIIENLKKLHSRNGESSGH